MKKYLKLLNGTNTVGNSSIAWGIFVLILGCFLAYPLFGSRFLTSNLTLFALYLPIALGLSLLWGYMGVLSFGQMAFFGISGYSYGILAINLQSVPGGTLIALVGGLAATGLLAGFFGYFVFYGEVSEWIIPVLTLVLTLVLKTFMAQTAGYQWKIGEALLGGYNGMTNIPSLEVGPLNFSSSTKSLYYLVFVGGTLIYLALRILVNSKLGSIIVAIREDTARTRMVGHHVNFIQVQVFILSALLAGLSGIFYVSWGNYLDPSCMGLMSATLPVVWVCVGGRQSLLAVVASTLLLGYLADILSVYGGEYALLVNGALLLGVMVFFPEGIFLTLAKKLREREIRKPQDREAVWDAAGSGKVNIEPPLAAFAIPFGAEPISGNERKIQRVHDSETVGESVIPETVRVEPLPVAVKAPARSGLILEVVNVSKSFGGVEAVSGFNLQMPPGELRSLIGPNGAGKSTLFSLVTGLYPVDSGEIYLSGQAITKLPSYQRVRHGISLKFQTTRIYHNLTVAENLQVPYHDNHKGEHNTGILEWALESFGLSHSMNVRVRNLSHGHQQWLEICLALTTAPKLLLLDEPTAGMTPEETYRTADFVKDLNATGMSILVVEHDMSFIRQLTCRVTILHNGRVFTEGSMEEIEANQEVRRIYLGE